MKDDLEGPTVDSVKLKSVELAPSDDSVSDTNVNILAELMAKKYSFKNYYLTQYHGEFAC